MIHHCKSGSKYYKNLKLIKTGYLKLPNGSWAAIFIQNLACNNINLYWERFDTDFIILWKMANDQILHVEILKNLETCYC